MQRRMDVVSSENTLVLPSCLLWNDFVFLRSQTTGIRHDEISIEKKTLLDKKERESFLSSRNTPMLPPVCSVITVCGRNQRTGMQEHYDEFSSRFQDALVKVEVPFSVGRHTVFFHGVRKQDGVEELGSLCARCKICMETRLRECGLQFEPVSDVPSHETDLIVQ